MAEEYADQLTERLMREMQAVGMAAMAQYARDHGLTAPPAHFVMPLKDGMVRYRDPKTIAALRVYWPDDRITVITTANDSPRLWSGRRDVSDFRY